MAIDLQFPPAQIDDATQPVVSFRQRWADQWAVVDGMHPMNATWTVAPNLPSASIEWRYGWVKPIGQADYVQRTKGTATGKRRWFVRIDYTTRIWYGFVEEAEDQQHGVGADNVPAGIVTLHCYGLEKLLADHVVDKSFLDVPAAHQVNRAFAFNALAGRPGEFANRSANTGPGFVHLFSADGDVSGQLWTTKQIVEYLLKYQVPVNQLGQVAIPFRISANAIGIPDWDKPQVQAEGQTTHSLLNQLIDRRRLLVWWLEVNSVANRVELVTNTLAAADIVINLAAPHVLPANPDQVEINLDDDPLTSVSVTNSGLQVVDQVVARGARKRSVATFSIEDGSLVIGWDTGRESEYEDGASNGTGYSTVGTKEKQRRNAEVRANPKLTDVYARFKIPSTWDWQVKDGVGGLTSRPVFLDPLGAIDKQAWAETFIDPTMPLLVGVDYSGTKIATGTVDESAAGDHEEMRPLVAFMRPDRAAGVSTDRWVKAEAVGQAAATERSGPNRAKQNEAFSLHVEVPPLSHSLVVRVLGAPQHAIAKTAFTRLAADEFAGYFDFDGGMVVTISLESQAYVEAYWPQVAPAVDAVRTKVIYAGDQYTQTYVVPETVVDIDDDGALVRSTGGFIPKQGPDDNESRLRSIAILAASWYTVEHRIMRLSTWRPISSANLDIGFLVVSVGGRSVDQAGGHHQVINSIVTQVSLSTPVGSGDQVSAPQLSVLTWAGDLDVQDDFQDQPAQQQRPGRAFPDAPMAPQPFIVDPKTGRGMINPEAINDGS